MKLQSISVDGSERDSLSRQSCTKWIPTNEQARILRDLYHTYGVRSPSVEQIQKISNRLRQYGKIEGKNVFYWFSNYKARERRKKKLPVDIPSSSNTTNPPGANATCFPPGLHAAGQMGSSDCPGSALTEKSYKCYFMGGGGGESVVERNKGWVMGLHSTAMSHHTRVQKAKIRTLPLFPIHTQEQEKVEEEEHQEGKQSVRSFVSGKPQQPKPIGHIPAFHLDGGQQQQEDHCCLELTLNSYHHTCSPEIDVISCKKW